MLVNVLLQIVNMKARGMEFLHIPDFYYDNLRERLKTAKIKVKEDISEVRDAGMSWEGWRQWRCGCELGGGGGSEGVGVRWEGVEAVENDGDWYMKNE